MAYEGSRRPPPGPLEGLFYEADLGPLLRCRFMNLRSQESVFQNEMQLQMSVLFINISCFCSPDMCFEIAP